MVCQATVRGHRWDRIPHSSDCLFARAKLADDLSSASCNGTFGTMFDSLETLHNCVIFPNVTAFPHDETGPTENALQLYSLDNTAESTAANVVEKLTACFVDYCTSLQGCEVPSGGDTRLYYGSYGDELINSICNAIPADINSDVGGIGVSKFIGDPALLCSQVERFIYHIGYRPVSLFWASLEQSSGNGSSLMHTLAILQCAMVGAGRRKKGKGVIN